MYILIPLLPSFPQGLVCCITWLLQNTAQTFCSPYFSTFVLHGPCLLLARLLHGSCRITRVVLLGPGEIKSKVVYFHAPEQVWRKMGREPWNCFPRWPIISLDALNFLYKANCIFPVVVSGISLSNAEVFLVLSLHLIGIHWLFLSSVSSNSSSLFSFPLSLISFPQIGEFRMCLEIQAEMRDENSSLPGWGVM